MEINVFLEKLFEKSEKKDVGVMGDNGNIIPKEGRKIQRAFLDSYHNEEERYVIDFADNRAKEGWLQFDTRQDAPYYGVWVNPIKLQTLNYAEGDWSLVTCDGKENYNREIQSMIDFHDEGKICTVITENGSSTVYRQDRNKFFIE